MKEITEQEFHSHLEHGAAIEHASKTIIRDPTVLYRRGDISPCAEWVFECYVDKRTQERWVRADKWKEWTKRMSSAYKQSKIRRAERKQRILRPAFGFISEVKRYLARGMTTAEIADLTQKPESEVIAARNVFNRDFSQPQPK